jgi:hypothetical protein
VLRGSGGGVHVLGTVEVGLLHEQEADDETDEVEDRGEVLRVSEVDWLG